MLTAFTLGHYDQNTLTNQSQVYHNNTCQLIVRQDYHEEEKKGNHCRGTEVALLVSQNFHKTVLQVFDASLYHIGFVFQ
jgi:hypothetical protein